MRKKSNPAAAAVVNPPDGINPPEKPEELGELGDQPGELEDPGIFEEPAPDPPPIPPVQLKIVSSISPEQKKSVDEIDESTTIGAFVSRVAGYLKKVKFKFAIDDWDRLYYFNGKCYKECTEAWVRNTILSNLPGQSRYKYSLRTKQEIVEQVKADAPALWRNPPTDRICVENGILNLITGVLSPHSPDWLSPIKIPIYYNPYATCKKWDDAIQSIFPDDSIDLAWEIVGSALSADTNLQQAAWLKGEGKNGKSTFIMAVQNFLGRENTVTVPVADLTKDTFATASLINKLLVVDTETPLNKINDIGIWKRIVSHDELRVQNKFETAFMFVPYAKMIMAGQLPPKVEDSTFGFLRRIRIIPFDKLGKADPDKVRDRDEVLAELAMAGEMSGALNKAMEGWRKTHKTGQFSMPPSIQLINDEYEHEVDSVRSWWDETIEETGKSTDSVLTEELYEGYLNYCEEHSLDPKSRIGVGQWISANTKAFKSRLGPERKWGHTRIRFRPLQIPEI